jgi:cell division protease FtsH
MTLGGRASEDIFFGKISTGAQNDLQQITRTAYSMVTVYGMSDKIGNVSFYDPSAENAFTKPYSEETSKLIDQEVRKLIDQAYVKTKALLVDKKMQVEKLAEELLVREVLFQSDVEKLIGKRPFRETKTLDVDDNPDHHAENGTISEGVPPYDGNITNHPPTTPA